MFHKLTQIKTKAVFLSLCLFLICKSISADSVPALSGWKMSVSDRGTTLLSRGNASIEIWPWVENGERLQDYVTKNQNLVPVGASLELTGKHIESEGLYSIVRRVRYQKQSHASLVTGCSNGQYIRLALLTAAHKDKLLGLGAATDYLESICKTKPVRPSSSRNGNTITENTESGKIDADIGNISSVWHLGDSDGLGVYWRTYLAFSDGMTTHDADTVISAGRQKSESRNPKKWRPYKIKDDTLLLGTSTGKTRKPFFSTRLKPGKSDQSYEGCWVADRSSIPSSTTATRAIFRSETYCFSLNGQYSTDANTVFTTDGITSSSDSNKNGSYQINGHTITFQATTGESLRAIFGWYQLTNDSHPRLVIGQYSYERK